MSDRMRPLSFSALMTRVIREYNTSECIFGIREFFHADKDRRLSMFGESIEQPFGPAAGPHTQLSQNIICAYLCGARFFELKTVQTLDGEDLPVSKPCILARDEGYNVEWSTELTVPEAMAEYIRAWFALKLISVEFDLGSPEGFIFNMSVGYDLEGIRSPKIDTFIEGLKNARGTEAFNEALDWTLANLRLFKHIDKNYVEAISPLVSRQVTLSTLHGCPPEEIERIATYLITEKKLNTFVKCNPTLLGYEFARSTLDSLGYDYIHFDDGHFRTDLQFSDAVPMFHRLSTLAESSGLDFGVKLSNTFPVDIAAGELPGNEMYMSGRSLFPLTLALAKKITAEFSGSLRISYSGGADADNIPGLFDAGIWPVTLATDILKPGGYNRFKGIAERLASTVYKNFEVVDEQALDAYYKSELSLNKYDKARKAAPSGKLSGKPPIADCFAPPCRGGCPIGQDIPAYLRLISEGKAREALEVITERNPLPNITGTICPHPCMDRCTRLWYEGAVDIRACKLSACTAEAELKIMRAPSNGKKVAVVGGGPSGMAAAFFAARAGAEVTLFEKTNALGGVVRHVIPDFRIPVSAIDADERIMRSAGVNVVLNKTVSSEKELIGFDIVILASGAEKRGVLRLKRGEGVNVIDFLTSLKSGGGSCPGKFVAVAGGGNSAMDAARAANRINGVERVAIIYRRTRAEMPADAEELSLAANEGIELIELASPVEMSEGKLICEKNALGKPDASGRRTPIGTGELFELPCNTLITAVGERADAELISKFPNAYVIGDAKNGPATVVEGIRDAALAVGFLLECSYTRHDEMNYEDEALALDRKKHAATCRSKELPEAHRCLNCGAVCESCVDVCPNRANVSIKVDGKNQILHLDYLCNGCGSCAVFCPYDGAPYRDKLTLYGSMKDFSDSKNAGFFPNGESTELRLDALEYGEDMDTLKTLVRIIKAVQQEHPYLMKG